MDKHLKREMTIEAVVGNYQRVKDFVRENLMAAGCDEAVILASCMAAEEIFTNIAYYAYDNEGGSADTNDCRKPSGTATIRLIVSPDQGELSLVFEDSGQKYDPLTREDPDITLAAKERKVGGLGIYMTKQVMDDIFYEYREGRNILTMKKHWEWADVTGLQYKDHS